MSSKLSSTIHLHFSLHTGSSYLIVTFLSHLPWQQDQPKSLCVVKQHSSLLSLPMHLPLLLHILHGSSIIIQSEFQARLPFDHGIPRACRLARQSFANGDVTRETVQGRLLRNNSLNLWGLGATLLGLQVTNPWHN